MINIFNPFDEKYFNKKSIANKEDANVVIRPTKRGKNPNAKKSIGEHTIEINPYEDISKEFLIQVNKK